MSDIRFLCAADSHLDSSLTGFARVAHASGEGPPLVTRLARSAMAITVFWLSNVRSRATISSDDPACFGGYVNDNLRAVAGQLTRADMVTLERNGFLGSFLPAADVAAHLSAIHAYAENAA